MKLLADLPDRLMVDEMRTVDLRLRLQNVADMAVAGAKATFRSTPVGGTLDIISNSKPTYGPGALPTSSSTTIVATKSDLTAPAREAGQLAPSLGWDDKPVNFGRLSDPIEYTLDVGARIDRYGEPFGTYASPLGVTFEARSLPPPYRSSV